MRILHVAQPQTGGVARYVLAAVADQRARGWAVTVACPDGALAESLDAAGIPRMCWPAGRSPGRGLVEESRALREILDAVDPELVHLHSAKAGLVGRLVIRAGLPTLFQPHGWSWHAAPVAAPARIWERVACRWTSRLICVSEGEAVEAAAAGLRLPPTVVRNGVDRNAFPVQSRAARNAARLARDIPLDQPVVLCPGRITRQKGQDLLLAAWPLVLDRCPRARLILLGAGDLAEQLHAMAPRGTQFVAEVADVRPWYALADLVVLPSRWEGLPLTALEAFASGRAVVANAVPGLREVLDSRCGAGVPPGDRCALAEAIATRITDRSRTEAEGRYAVAHVAGMDLKRTLDRLAAVTEETLGSSRAVRAGARAARGTAAAAGSDA
ncbi:glycosyltransferase [Sciscionella sediminilitoris]|uniref:glycosyltransferase n=1 Tax=Sciscionella sediminilitoris TaxID=1445613 RepID=UPI0007C7F44C|nr:glycosyltransferase [Sciscionella sp. SE31]